MKPFGECLMRNIEFRGEVVKHHLLWNTEYLYSSELDDLTKPSSTCIAYLRKPNYRSGEGITDETGVTTMSNNADDESRAEGFKNWLSRYSEEEQAALLILIGAILFFFPEPITSVIGILVLVVGIATWVADWIWG